MLKKIVIITFLILIFIPFVLIRDIFPFFRFGMFAEAIKRNSQKEVFRIRENIRSNHTSHNRVSDFLNTIGLKEEAKKCIVELQKITSKY